MSSSNQQIVQFYFRDEHLKGLAFRWTAEIPEGRKHIRDLSLSGAIKWSEGYPKHLAVHFSVCVNDSSCLALCVKIEGTQLVDPGYVGISVLGSTVNRFVSQSEARDTILSNRSLGKLIRGELKAIKIIAVPYQRSECKDGPFEWLYHFGVKPSMKSWIKPLMVRNPTNDATIIASTIESDDEDLPQFSTVRSANVFDKRTDGSIDETRSNDPVFDAASALTALASMQTRYAPADSLAFTW